MMNRILYFSVLLMTSFSVAAGARDEPEREPVQLVPLLKYDYLSLSDQSIHSSSAGLVVNGNDVLFVGLYTQHRFEKPLQNEYPHRFHSIDILLDGKKGRHQYIGIFKSESDQPVTGGLSTYQAGTAYGYEVIKKSNLSLVVGGGLAVGDFGIETSKGKTWPIIPVPLVRMKYKSNWLDAKFEFLTSPNLDFTLAPKSRVRLTGEFRMDQFRDVRDLIFECNVAYRFFSSDHKMGDFAGLSLGFKNDNYGAFNLGSKGSEETLEVHYNSIFAAIDLSLLKVSAGYAFKGRSLYRETLKQDIGEGYFVSLQGMYPF